MDEDGNDGTEKTQWKLWSRRAGTGCSAQRRLHAVGKVLAES